jgi:hypothetical protein
MAQEDWPTGKQQEVQYIMDIGGKGPWGKGI